MDKKFISNKELSRLEYGANYATNASGKTRVEFDPERFERGIAQRQAEALESIATSSAKMADGFNAILLRLSQVEKERDRYKKLYCEEEMLTAQLNQQISNQKGWITRLKNKISSISTAIPENL